MHAHCDHCKYVAYLSQRHAPSYDLLVVGGGIVGMATARELALRYPEMSIALVEKEPRLGEHSQL